MSSSTRARKGLLALLVFGALGPATAFAQDVTLDAVGRGQINGANLHVSSYPPLFISAYSIGTNGSPGGAGRSRNFFVFDLPAPPSGQEAVAATLRLFVPSNLGAGIQGGPSQVDVHDVDAPISALENSTALFDDLGDGPIFGSRIYSDADEGTFTEIALNAEGLASLNAALGGPYALSMRHTQEDFVGNDERFVFAGSGSVNSPVQDGNSQLLITWGPAASTGCTYDLIADGGSPLTATTIGTVSIEYDATAMAWMVTYETTGDWWMTAAHTHATCDPLLLPMTGSGNPRVGRFDYQGYGFAQQATFLVPDLGCLDETYFAAHAAIVEVTTLREETAWAGGAGSYMFPGRSWATYVDSDCGN